MNIDQLLEAVSYLCLKLLPIVGVVLLIFLIVFIKHLIDVMKSVNVTLYKTNDLVDECKGQIRKLDKPLNTISDLSESIDDVHASAKNAVNTAINAIITNLEKVKEWVSTHKPNSTKKDPNEVVIVNETSATTNENQEM